MKYCILAMVAFSLAACSPAQKSDENLNGPVWVQLPVTNGEKYSLSPVEILSLKNLKRLSGLAAQFFIDPAVENGELSGRSPDFKYIRADNDVVVPTDSLSLQLASVYMHMEKLKILDESAGAGSINKWPRKVAVNAIYSAPGEGRLFNNALYSGQIDAMVFVPYIQDDLPVMVNAGVIGHEHFHSLFYKTVIVPLGDKYPEAQKATVHDEQAQLEQMGAAKEPKSALETEEDRDLYHAVVLRGLNEGLADVWGWIYSGDVDFVHRSIPQEKITRRIDLPLQRLSSATEIRNYVNLYASSGQTMGVAYSLGNQFARALKTLAEFKTEQKLAATTEAGDKSADETQSESENKPKNKEKDKQAIKQMRLETAKMIIKSLPMIKDKVASLGPSEMLSPAVVLEAFASQWSKSGELNYELCSEMMKLTPAEDEPQITSCRTLLDKP